MRDAGIGGARRSEVDERPSAQREDVRGGAHRIKVDKRLSAQCELVRRAVVGAVSAGITSARRRHAGLADADAVAVRVELRSRGCVCHDVGSRWLHHRRRRCHWLEDPGERTSRGRRLGGWAGADSGEELINHEATNRRSSGGGADSA